MITEEPFGLAGKTAVVTGGGSGIGRESARILAAAGANVIVADINEQGLEETGALLLQAHANVVTRKVDVADQAAVDVLAADAVARFGTIDVWVNVAGISFVHDILDAKADEAQRTIAVNMMGPYWGCMAAGRIMAEQRSGSIISVSSEGGSRPVPGLSIYGMTKAAVNSLTWTAAREFGPMGIRVNAIAPGWVDTPIAEVLYRDQDGNIDVERRDELLRQMAARSSLGLIGQPSDIAYAVQYLASNASRFVTGQVFTINGGET
jgi:3-oxoacyl-[acyl-carrier protein] reductase